MAEDTSNCPFSTKVPSNDKGQLTECDIGNWILKSSNSYSVENTPEWQEKRKQYKSSKNTKSLLLKNILKDTESFNRKKESSKVSSSKATNKRLNVKERIEKVANWNCDLPLSSNNSERGSSTLLVQTA